MQRKQPCKITRYMKPYVHEVRYYECDGMAITHHSNYIRFMEEARIDWMDQLGFGFEKMESAGVVSPVMSISCQYKCPTKFKDKIEITLHVTEMSTLKMSFSYEMRVGDKVIATASSTHCFMAEGRPIAIEQHFPELYQAIVSIKEPKEE